MAMKWAIKNAEGKYHSLMFGWTDHEDAALRFGTESDAKTHALGEKMLGATMVQLKPKAAPFVDEPNGERRIFGY